MREENTEDSFPVLTIGSLDRLSEADYRERCVDRLPEIVIYEHIDFGGASERTNLNWYYVGDWWNDKISSIVIASGVWQFFEHWHYEGASWVLGPGYYRWVESANIPNDIISSFKCIQLTD